MSKSTSSHAYGISIITIIVGLSVGLAYYQMFYLPETLAKPSVSDEILKPVESVAISMISGSSNQNQQDNFIPKLVDIQLGIDNHVIWTNQDDVAHTVTPDNSVEDSYSGPFGSSGVVKPGDSYEFLFTEPHEELSYHCDPHPWMTGKLIITKARF